MIIMTPIIIVCAFDSVHGIIMQLTFIRYDVMGGKGEH